MWYTQLSKKKEKKSDTPKISHYLTLELGEDNVDNEKNKWLLIIELHIINSGSAKLFREYNSVWHSTLKCNTVSFSASYMTE